MIHDAIIEELRAIRQEIERTYHNDAKEYYHHLLDVQTKYHNRLVRRQPKPAFILRDKRKAA